MAQKQKGFTLIELLVVIAIVGLLATIILVNLNQARMKGQVTQAGLNARSLKIAAELYYNQMGFYPPDVGRGWDPGFRQPLPYNPDTGGTTIPSCGHCPSDWVNIVQTKWDGPYLNTWPRFTPWGGKYDYNYWGSGASRYGCIVPPGIYAGVQGDYSNNNTIPAAAEQEMLDQEYDFDGCLNGEAQMVLILL